MKSIVSTLSLSFIILISSGYLHADEEQSYVDCLKSSFSGNHNFTAEEVRSLCREISGSDNPSYSWDEDKKMTPNNQYTACYEDERLKMKSLGDKKAREVAKIVCLYKAR